MLGQRFCSSIFEPSVMKLWMYSVDYCGYTKPSVPRGALHNILGRCCIIITVVRCWTVWIAAYTQYVFSLIDVSGKAAILNDHIPTCPVSLQLAKQPKSHIITRLKGFTFGWMGVYWFLINVLYLNIIAVYGSEFPVPEKKTPNQNHLQ